MAVTEIDHPLAQHLLGRLRDQETPPQDFRQDAAALGQIIAIEATRSVRTKPRRVQTPIQGTEVQGISERLAVVPILRAGLAMLDPFLSLFPDVTVGYIGLERNEETAEARSYYRKLPDLSHRCVIVLDPMLATGGSAAQALDFVKAEGAARCIFACVVAAPEGIAVLEQRHPEVPIITAAVDERLDERKYIVPGLGDFGDRMFGT